MAQWYFDEDGDLSLLDGKTIGIFGYGNQGRSQALNMRDQGATVIVGSRSDSSAEQAREDGFETLPLGEAAARANIHFILVPDEIMPQVMAEHIASGLSAGDTLVFASGYNIHFNKIEPRADVNVVMIAPRMIGRGVREKFLDGTGYPSLVAVHQDASGNAQDILIALSKAIGSTKMGVIESSFEEETVVDLFAEQSGYLHAVRRGYEALTEAGCSPEAVMLELYASGELREAADYMMELGLFEQMKLHSRTSQYGQIVYGRPSPGEEEADKERLREVIAKIKDGRFAAKWTEVQENGSAELEAGYKQMREDPMMVEERKLYKRLGRL
ncbi:ketol-acid reductoisomerase [Hoeflea prorocentri]|uniref:Ketol-acid reductoisomerase n=1 Tax=Hoeflea prorocentri TaxID=1922333 RepID=A0A9X3UJE4_9HYPH|nr:ketol-acid reductoisomerase [Hoeflea prorocentri]MCY6382457.1 ketol-acid reductoisomerase [Hoeflea prorocentri]MDA5400257.1 ketol-acid reductoisomerase [Hoeflea prorocentri]